MTRKTKIMVGISVILSVLLMLVNIQAKAEYDITKFLWLDPYLERDIFITDMFRNVGWFIHDILGTVDELAISGFTMIAKWDVMDIPIVKTVATNLVQLREPMIVIGIIVVTCIRFFDLSAQLKTITNLMVMMLCMTIFAGVFDLMLTVKDAGIKESNYVLGKSDYTISEKLLMDNTVDIVKSLENGSIQNINEQDIKFFPYDLRLDWDYLDEYIVRDNGDGTYMTEELSGGLFGVGEVHYYRYKTDWLSVNITLLVSAIVYILAIFKLGYLIGQQVQQYMFGGSLMVMGIWDKNKIGKIFSSIAKTMFGIVLIYFMMLWFSFFCSDVMGDKSLDNWLAKSILIFSVGMMTIVGSGFINDTLGIDDGSQFALRSIFMADRLGRMVSRPIKSMKRHFGHGGKGGNGSPQHDTPNDSPSPSGPSGGGKISSDGGDTGERSYGGAYDANGNQSTPTTPSGRYDRAMDSAMHGAPNDGVPARHDPVKDNQSNPSDNINKDGSLVTPDPQPDPQPDPTPGSRRYNKAMNQAMNGPHNHNGVPRRPDKHSYDNNDGHTRSPIRKSEGETPDKGENQQTSNRARKIQPSEKLQKTMTQARTGSNSNATARRKSESNPMSNNQNMPRSHTESKSMDKLNDTDEVSLEDIYISTPRTGNPQMDKMLKQTEKIINMNDDELSDFYEMMQFDFDEEKENERIKTVKRTNGRRK